MSVIAFYLLNIAEVLHYTIWHTTNAILTASHGLSLIKSVYKDHPWDPKIVAVVDRWSLFRGHLCNKSAKWDLKMVVVVDKWSLAQVWL